MFLWSGLAKNLVACFASFWQVLVILVKTGKFSILARSGKFARLDAGLHSGLAKPGSDLVRSGGRFLPGLSQAHQI